MFEIITVINRLSGELRRKIIEDCIMETIIDSIYLWMPSKVLCMLNDINTLIKFAVMSTWFEVIPCFHVCQYPKNHHFIFFKKIKNKVNVRSR